MTKRFIVLLGSTTKAQNQEFVSFLSENHLGWWHYFSDSWLLISKLGKISSEEIRDKVKEIYPGVNNLVLEFYSEGDTWAGFGPSNEKQNMFKWLHKNWH